MIISLKVPSYYFNWELLAIQSIHFLNGTHLWFVKPARAGFIYQRGTVGKRNVTHLWLDEFARTGFIHQGLASDRVGMKQRCRPFLHYGGWV